MQEWSNSWVPHRGVGEPLPVSSASRLPEAACDLCRWRAVHTGGGMIMRDARAAYLPSCRAGRACYMLSGPSPAVRPPRQCRPRWRSGDESGEPFTGDQSVSTSSTASASLRLISSVIRRLPCQVKRVSWPSSLLISALAIRAAWGFASVKTNPDGG